MERCVYPSQVHTRGAAAGHVLGRWDALLFKSSGAANEFPKASALLCTPSAMYEPCSFSANTSLGQAVLLLLLQQLRAMDFGQHPTPVLFLFFKYFILAILIGMR